MVFHKPENTGTSNQNLPEGCSLLNEYSILVKDPWIWEDTVGFGIGGSAAIRKQSCILDYLQDSDNSSDNEFTEQQQKLQVEEEDCLRGSLFEATDDQLWRPQTPLPITETLFSLDSTMGGHDCMTLLQDESIAQGAASCFRIWEQDGDEKFNADGISFLYEYGVSDWIWGFPCDQSQFSESVEFESSLPSL